VSPSLTGLNDNQLLWVRVENISESGICVWWCVRAPPPVLGIWPSKRKLNEENSKHGSSPQQNGFGPTFSHRMLLRLVKGTAEPAVDWLDNLIGRGGLLLVVSHLFTIPVLVLWLVSRKKVNN
jgi:hypothetical protein